MWAAVGSNHGPPVGQTGALATELAVLRVRFFPAMNWVCVAGKNSRPKGGSALKHADDKDDADNSGRLYDLANGYYVSSHGISGKVNAAQPENLTNHSAAAVFFAAAWAGSCCGLEG